MCATNHLKRPRILRDLKPLVLASKSPRRQELLAGLGLEFEVYPSRLAEPPAQGQQPEDYVSLLAGLKARSVASLFPHAGIIAADTVVVCEGKILGKPRDKNEARAMLQRLSGRTHKVFTGYTILYQKQLCTRSVGTEVLFKKLKAVEIEAYLATGEPMDKAGAYAIQGIASYMIREVRGSVTNVIGLPLSELVEDLLRLGLVQWEITHEEL